MPNKPAADGTSINIRVPRKLRERMEACALRDRRLLSDWVRLQLEDATAAALPPAVQQTQAPYNEPDHQQPAKPPKTVDGGLVRKLLE